jgi:hypothetical protein
LFFLAEGTRAERLAKATADFGGNAAVDQFLGFIRESGNRPLALPRRGGVDSTNDDYADDDDA